MNTTMLYIVLYICRALRVPMQQTQFTTPLCLCVRRFPFATLVSALLVGTPTPATSQAAKQSPDFRWTVVDTMRFGGTLLVRSSYAPATVKVNGDQIRVWVLRDSYRASDNYREKQYSAVRIDCSRDSATEETFVMDRFGRGKPPRYGRLEDGFSDYDMISRKYSSGTVKVLSVVAKKHCPAHTRR